MISYGKQYIDESDIKSVVKVLRGDWLTQGPSVEQFENDLKAYFGSKYVSAVSNGTAALHLAGLSLGWKSDDIILTSPITFLASANSIVFTGATPDFVDIDKNNYTIDPNKAEEKIKHYRSLGKKIKAIIAVDYAGYPCDWESLKVLQNKYDIQLVNDNCHAIGASYNGEKEFMGASVSYKYDKKAEVFHVDLSIGFPANMSYSEKDVLNQFEKELIKSGWKK